RVDPSRPRRGPHLACSTAPFFSRPLADAFESIADAGFRDVEVMVTRDPATQDGRRIRELAGRHEVTVRAIHAPFLLMTRKVWGTDPVGKVYRAIELAEHIEVPLVVVHPPYRWQAGYRRWIEERLPNLSSDTGVRVAVENMFPLRVRERGVRFHAHQAMEDLERFDHVVLDTSHAAVTAFDPVETARRLGGRLAHVHLSNNAGKGWDSHLPVDQGVLDLDAFLEALIDAGFGGTVSLELDLRPYLSDDGRLADVLRRNRSFCAERLPLPA
ncbi:MAG TPA: sugar phosphate isomerase/epimerase, partial [Actinomycetota bacterium]|nr:sugar phosphate isomerase/epimerase [Actinomycetota bacterium]